MDKLIEDYIRIRLPTREKNLIKQAAEITGMSMSEYIRLVMNHISIGIVMSKDAGGDDIIILAESLRSAIHLKAYKLGALYGDSFGELDDSKRDPK